MIENYSDHHLTTKGKLAEVRAKDDYTPPLFCLLTNQEYRLTMAIVSRADNPYLQYANSPQELLLSVPLFSTNPSLGPEVLKRYHFGTLLFREFAEEHATDSKG
jgi:hypothetical protein